MNMNVKIAFRILSPILLLTFLVGCGRKDNAEMSAFDMPPSLVDRMRTSYNEVRNKKLGADGLLDGEEMMALMRLGYENATQPSHN